MRGGSARGKGEGQVCCRKGVLESSVCWTEEPRRLPPRPGVGSGGSGPCSDRLLQPQAQKRRCWNNVLEL